MQKFLAGVFFLFIIAGVHAEEFANDDFRVTISRATSPITVDGVLDEPAWSTAAGIDDFWEHYPIDSLKAYKRTEVHLAYSDGMLYIGAVCYDTRKKPVVQSLVRDDEGSFWLSDAFSIVLDPLNNGSNGYFFGVNAGGGEIDALVVQNGFYPTFDNYWSNKWYSAVGSTEQGFVYEMAIPLSIMSSDPGNTTWGANFLRNDLEFKNSYHIWTKFGIAHDGRDLGFLGRMAFDSIPQSKQGRFNIIPSITGGAKKEYTDDEKEQYDFIYGLDAKIAITPKTNLDLMVVPDFSQADVDREYLDFGRHEYYMREQRQFFLESSDLFTDFGSDNFKPIYTRRIGIQDWENYKIWGGGRLTGTIGKNFRYGFLTVQTDEFKEAPAENFTILTMQQQLGQSRVKVLGTNIESFEGTTHLDSNYNRTVGADYRYTTKNDKVSMYGGLNKSFTLQESSDGYFANGGIDYNGSNLHVINKINYVTEEYENSLGFFNRTFKEDPVRDTTIRQGIMEVRNRAEYFVYPKLTSPFSYYFPVLKQESYYSMEGSLEERVVGAEIHGNHKNTGFSSFYSWRSDVYLDVSTEVIEDKLLPPGHYRAYGAGIFHKTDERKMFRHAFNLKFGEYYSGTKLEFYNSLIWRMMPHAKVTADYTYCRLDFPDPEIGSAEYHLSGLQTDIFFSRDIIWTTLFQLNTQNDHAKVNSRLQWRYSPMSSFYLVVADNYNADTWNEESISITAKLTYWLSR